MRYKRVLNRGRRALAEVRMKVRGLAPRRPAVGVSNIRRDAVAEDAALAISDALPGWLNTPAAKLTFALLGQMPMGPAVEIGVFRGKYLSILRAALGRDCRIVGYDIFDAAQAPLVERELGAAFGGAGDVVLYRADSTTLTPKRVLEDCGAPPMFMSVDGSHEAGPVLSDMRLCDVVLAPLGVVAMDDFINPLALGVNEAVGRYLGGATGDLAPFLYVSNKLLMCRRAQLDHYRQVTRDVLAGRDTDPDFQWYLDIVRSGGETDRTFYGSSVVIASP